MKIIEIDARGKILGRLATNIATVLRGKDQPTWRPDRMSEIQVIVKNADQYAVTGKKNEQKNYYHFSGYPGGLKTTSLKRMRVIKPEMVLYQAVSRMLPKNRLRAKFLKNLKLEIAAKS